MTTTDTSFDCEKLINVITTKNSIYISDNIYVTRLTTFSHHTKFKVIEKCTNFYFGTEKLPPKF